MKLIRADSLVESPIEWLWEGRIPLNHDTILEGDPGVSKSSLAMMLAAHVSQGRQWPDGSRCLQGNVVVISGEDPEHEVIKPRLVACEADCERVYILSSSAEENLRYPFTIPQDIPALAKVLQDLSVRLVIIDPLDAFIDSRTASYITQQVRQGIGYLERMAQTLGCSVLIIRHLAKNSKEKSLIYRGLGSIALIAGARAAFTVIPDPSYSSRKLFLPIKGNWSEPKPGFSYHTESITYLGPAGDTIATSKIVWEHEVAFDAGSVIEVSDAAEEKTLISEARELILAELAEGERPAREILRLGSGMGISRRVVQRAASLLGVTRSKHGFGAKGEWTWVLPETETTTNT